MSIEAYVKKQQGQSNYEIQKSRAGQLLATHDLQASSARLGLRFDGSHVYIKLFDLSCRVRCSDGYADCAASSGGEFREADFNTAMTLYDLLGYASPDAHPAGDYAPLESFSRIYNARSYAGEGAFTDTAQEFDLAFGKLAPACEALGGVPFGKGDVSCRIPLFKDLCMVLSFWRADDEFPPSLILSFDRNTTQYLHYETMWYAAGLCVRRIRAHFS